MIYIRADIHIEFLNYISKENRNSFKHKNILKIFTYQRDRKKINAIISTAA
jgi:hypothetical protein